MEELCQPTASDKAYIAVHDLTKHSARISYSFNVEESSISAYNNLLQGSNPWTLKEGFFQARGLVWSGDQIVRYDDLRQSDFYMLFMAPEAMLHSAHMVLHVEGPVVSELVLTRRPDDIPYTERDLDRLRELGESLLPSIILARELNLASLGHCVMFDALHDLSVGLAFVTEGRRSFRTNEAFRTHMQRLDTEDGTAFFQEVPRHAAVKLPSTLVRSLRAAERERIHLLPRLEGGVISVHVSSAVTTCPVTGSSLKATCLLSLDAQEEVTLDGDCLLEAFNLTPAEVRVSAGIASCKRIESIAGELGITPSTARTHLKHVFDKTDTRRQSELTRLMGTVARNKRRGEYVSQTLEPGRPAGTFFRT